ncbi:DUF1616 domain-containing protein [Staphylothermus hellenicus]|uniref:DUF1616 domain-containing protein n=1 Tax=Staphylothermus hellenicus (strain DSM 12710 / JCM 10830 / BK20S6-10-b1 / P8) TaxID=591019 RepID=D7D880_STAHD|nr:DUF1616 domain-containing protein [Staphylothermus hellenicus]ADI31976.1 hypothetical protein Shell_0866 [Staphylothermus hellenicus DSM 12710]
MPSIEKYVVIIAFVLVLLYTIYPIVYSENLDSEVANVLKDIDYLYNHGVNVEDLVHKLDQAVKLINNGDYDRAKTILSGIKNEIASLKSKAETIYLYKTIYKYGLVAILLSLPILAYFLIPRIYLYLWYRLRRGWIVKRVHHSSGEKNSGSYEEVFAVIMAIIVVASVFAAAQVLRPRVVEPFTALGLLNENCVIGDYPREVVVGDNITLCIFVDNHMNEPIYYRVIYRIGTNNTIPTNTTPSPEPEIKEWRGVLNQGENTTFKIVVPISYSGNTNTSRIALIFELWIYNVDSNEWIYTGRWNHLYVKPVSPGG